MAIDTSKSVDDYAVALRHLLPPGEYFSGDDVNKITLTQADELARIHAKVDGDFNINTSQDALGWTLNDYQALLNNAGVSDFQVFDKYRLPMVAGLKVGKPLGDIVNVTTICINFPESQQKLFNNLIPTLLMRKLSHTRLLVNGSNLLV